MRRTTCMLMMLSFLLTACAAAVSTGENAPLTASGFLESEEVSIVSEVDGLVRTITVDEGQTVSQGEILITLDDTLLQAERLQALAGVNTAKSALESLLAGAGEEELAVAEGTISEAEASLRQIQISSGAAWTAVNAPSEIDVQIANAQIEADLALQRIGVLEAQIGEQQFMIDLLRADNREIDKPRIENEERLLAILIAQKTAAELEYQGALRTIETLEAQRQQPLALIAQANSYSAQIPVAEIGVELAQTQYDMIANGSTREEIAVAEARLGIAEAQLALIDAKIAQLTLRAPIDGSVTTRAIHEGETASPGIALMSLADLTTLKLVVYITEPNIGRVQVGAEVRMTVDAYPGEQFTGIVTRIADEAEYTPRNVQTAEERVDLVFAVEIIFDNEDGRLKAGMPAEAIISSD